jgi:hypothetical protein
MDPKGLTTQYIVEYNTAMKMRMAKNGAGACQDIIGIILHLSSLSLSLSLSPIFKNRITEVKATSQALGSSGRACHPENLSPPRDQGLQGTVRTTCELSGPWAAPAGKFVSEQLGLNELMWMEDAQGMDETPPGEVREELSVEGWQAVPGSRVVPETPPGGGVQVPPPCHPWWL